jgi:hypothetical protein
MVPMLKFINKGEPMKLFISFIVLMSSSAFSAECGKLQDLAYNSSTGLLKSFKVATRTKLIRITANNSKSLVEAVYNAKNELDYGNSPEFFVCLDKYKIVTKKYNGKELTYANVNHFRLWNKGEFLMSVPAQATTEEPTNTTMDELIDHMGEYFSEDEVHDFGLGYDYVKKSEISKKLAKAIKAAVDDRNEWLAPQGSVYDYEVYKIHDDENIVGYIIAIHDDIDHPLWDGSGVTVYLDLDFSVIDEVTWEG